MVKDVRASKSRLIVDLAGKFTMAALVPLAFVLAWSETDFKHETNIQNTLDTVNGADYRAAGGKYCYYKADRRLTVSFQKGPDLTKLWLTGDFWLHKMHLANDPLGQPVEAGSLPYFKPVDCRFAGGPMKVYRGASEILEETAGERAQLAAKLKTLAKSGGNTSRFIVSVPKP